LIELQALTLPCLNSDQCRCHQQGQPWLEITDEETGERVWISGCPYVTLPVELLPWFRWYRWWQQGLLPGAGGLLDQSAKYLEVMEYLDGLIVRKEARDADERRARPGAALS